MPSVVSYRRHCTGKSLHEYGKVMSAFTPSIHCAHTVLMSMVGPFLKRTFTNGPTTDFIRCVHGVRAEY